MALHKQVDFALLCGVSKAYLSVNKKRGKIILSGDYVDDSIEPNISFLKKCLEKKQSEPEQEPEPDNDHANTEKANEHSPALPETPNVSKPVFKQTLTKKISEPKEKEIGGYELNQNKLQLQIENLELKNRELEQKIDTKLGETIPKEPVVIAFRYITKNICTNIKTSIENLITRYEKNFTPEQFAAVRAGIIKEINTAQTNASEQSKKQISEIVAISSTKKEVGERE
jgi:hypothetical protein